MGREYYIYLIIQSFVKDPRFYFLAKMKILREIEGYSDEAITEGFMDAFKWIYAELNKTDLFNCKITLPDGNSWHKSLSTDRTTRRKELAVFGKIGTISYPFLKELKLLSADGQIVNRLTKGSMLLIWPYLHVSLYPNYGSNKPILAPAILDPSPDGCDDFINLPEWKAWGFPQGLPGSALKIYDNIPPIVDAYGYVIKTSDIGNPLIFPETILNRFHAALDDYIWESVDIATCKNWFRVRPIGKPMFKKGMVSYFCYAVGEINHHRNKEICSEIQSWLLALRGKKTELSKLKKLPDNQKKSEVNERLARLRVL